MFCKVAGFRMVFLFVGIIYCARASDGQELSQPQITFRQLLRTMTRVPQGRSAKVGDVYLRLYSTNSSEPTSYHLKVANNLLKDPGFDRNKPTMVYAHGYVELLTDKSAQTVVKAYLKNSEYNVVMLDWANLAFRNYVLVGLDVPTIGEAAGVALSGLVKRGLEVSTLHLVGHSLGAHLIAYAARHLAASGHMVPRLTGLDPAYPGFYPAILGQPMTRSDAVFVDVIHTDAGGYGTPVHTGHADWWPNGGRRRQPACRGSVVLTDQDFCSHWRSWAYWAESVTGGEFLSRRCHSYSAFVRADCRDNTSVYMGLRATSDLRGNFYLRTAGSSPYNLGVAGAD